MNRYDLLKIALEIAESTTLQMNLSNHSSIDDSNDFDEVEVFFSKYSSQYNIKLFEFSSNTFIAKKNYNVISKIFNKINSLSPINFEKISALLCNVLNYSNYYATKPTRDEGIDFLVERKDNDYLNTVELLFGQCKHFAKKLVTVGEIRELAGAITLFKNGEFMSDTSYVNIVKTIKSHSSLKTIFVTSYFFSNEAKEVCSKSSIVPIDIFDLLHLFFKGITEEKINWTDKNRSIFYERKFNNDLSNITTIK